MDQNPGTPEAPKNAPRLPLEALRGSLNPLYEAAESANLPKAVHIGLERHMVGLVSALEDWDRRLKDFETAGREIKLVEGGVQH